ncbi:Sec-independent protein translocase protein TatB [Mycobacterium sp.]|uniref:Sec-independent protein translocase protein TatB n=1 Tax=Mycobacterium sp. TaxID=1785 RepID=UPI0025F8B82F|nr:Sec-independent protein translocase protein TatB [Mycobacterium sp.]
MFANVGWGEILVLIVVGLVVLGPERLPGAIRWMSSSLRQARDYLSGMTTQLREDMGPEFDNLREPLSELQKLRGMTPRAALTKHLFDGDDSLFRSFEERPINGTPATPSPNGPVVQPITAHQAKPATGPAPYDTDAT